MIKTDNLTDKDIIYLCKNNPKIRTAMALKDEFKEIANEVKKWLDISPERLKVIENFWNRNNK